MPTKKELLITTTTTTIIMIIIIVGKVPFVSITLLSEDIPKHCGSMFPRQSSHT